MISIVISEKGGAERRETYEKPEISIGRVKGNDVLLAKGNVSKRHARLMVRDGRFIVTDLKSTNGTYVNHRRITHATLVREGDRIYIGDFVLWVEGDGLGASSSYRIAPDSGTTPSSHGSSVDLGPVSPSIESSSGPPDEVVSHFPIEHDPDDPSMLDVPIAPRVPTELAGPTGTSPSPLEGGISSYDQLAEGSQTLGEQSSSLGQSSQPRVDRAKLAAQQGSYEKLVTAVEQQLALDELDGTSETAPALVEQVEAEIDKQLAAMTEASPLPVDLDERTLARAARRELLELGPLEALLEDDKISEVQVRLREISMTRRGRKQAHLGLHFATESGVSRVLNRLCAGAASLPTTDEPYVERELPDGRQLYAICPPVSPNGRMLVISKPVRAHASLNTLVRQGTISRGMATLLAHCVTARANILVVGSTQSDTAGLVDALAGAVAEHERVVWLGDEGGKLPESIASIKLGESPKQRLRAIRAAATLRPDHLIVPPMAGDELAGILDAIAQGAEGLVMSANAATLRQAVGRLCATLATTRQGLTMETAREWLGSALDLGVEVARLRDGRLRATRLAEFRTSSKGTSLRDVFTFAYHRTAAGGSIEGAFYATGTIPYLVEELAARGLPLDTSIFRRHPSG